MVRLLFDLNHHIIDLGILGFTHDWLEYFGDHSLICGSSVFQPEGHDFVAEYAARVMKAVLS